MEDWERINIDKKVASRGQSSGGQRAQRSQSQRPQQRSAPPQRQRQSQPQTRRTSETRSTRSPASEKSTASDDLTRPIVPRRNTAQSAAKSTQSAQTNGSTKKSRNTSKKQKVDNRSKDEKRKEYAEGARKHRKIKVAITLFFAVLMVAAIIAVLSLTVLFKIETITVDGDTRYTAEQIIENSGVKVGDNLWRTTSEKVTTVLAEALPYVKSVTVERSIPSSVVLKIEEATPLYSIEKNKKYILVDENDKVLDSSAEKSGKSVKIKGLKLLNTKAGTTLTVQSSKEFTVAKEIVTLALDSEMTLSEIDVSDINLIMAIYSSRLKLEFGSRNDIEKKIKMASEVIKKLESEENRQQGTINVKSSEKAFFIEEAITEEQAAKDDKKGGNKSDSVPSDTASSDAA